MTKRLYSCSLQIDVMIVAGSIAEAQRIASRAASAELSNYASADFEVKPARRLVDGWDGRELPYGEAENLTAAEWLEKPKGEKDAV